MKLAGFALLLSGWIIVIFAVGLFTEPGLRAFFVVAGFLVEFAGIVLVGIAHRQLAGRGA